MCFAAGGDPEEKSCLRFSPSFSGLAQLCRTWVGSAARLDRRPAGRSPLESKFTSPHLLRSTAKFSTSSQENLDWFSVFSAEFVIVIHSIAILLLQFDSKVFGLYFCPTLEVVKYKGVHINN